MEFKTIWSLHGGNTTCLGHHASDMATSLTDVISRELEHVVHVQQDHPALLGDTSLSQSGNSPSNLERQVTIEADEREGGISTSRTQVNLFATDEATAFLWQISLTGAAKDPPPLPTRSCAVQPTAKSSHNINFSSFHPSDKAKTNETDFASAAAMPQPVRFDIVSIGSEGQIAGTTVGAVDVSLLCI